MNMASQSWRRVSAETIGELPESAAVFEVANLVRTVQYIGSADNLRARIGQFWQELRPSPGGYYLRYETAAREQEALATHLASYRAGHGGMLPTGNAQASRALRVPSRRAA
jgi:hypothetical protein